MYWVDEIVEKRTGEEWINDSWTPSGIVHMGSLKGPVIHDVLYHVLKRQGKTVKFTYGFDDADTIDGLPPELKESHSKYMGVPIYLAPSPDGNGTFGDFYGNKMKALLEKIGIEAEVYRTSDLYKKGDFNKAIIHVLNNAQKVRNVYSEIYNKQIADDWFPLQVLCPTCGKLGTTKVTAWDGREVTYTCEKNLVTWAEGCGTTGKIDPLNGNGKMPWKVEWAAKWWTWGVTIEGAGKDHGSAGGSYDVARKICRDVFGSEPPLKIVYEFFLSMGRKMSSSKGIGMNGEELLEVLSPEVARFLMIKTRPNQAVEFEPRNSYVIPKLYDDYQKAAEYFFTKNDEERDIARSFELAQIKIENPITPPTIGFSKIATLVQMPNMRDTLHEYDANKWEPYAKLWIQKYAPENDTFTIAKEIPALASSLTEKQRAYLQKVAEELHKDWNAEDLQVALYEWTKEIDITSKEAFAALYTVLIGKTHGPRAAWLILDQPKEFINQRFTSDIASVTYKTNTQSSRIKKFNNDSLFHVALPVFEQYTSISIGIAVIKGVTIQKTNEALEKEKQEVLASLSGLTTEELGQYPEILSYRKLYKSMGVDWHSRRPSPEALLRRVALNKGLYNVNTCVDAYNLIVMKHRISVGAFDLDKIHFPTELRFPKPGEQILLLGDQTPIAYTEKELAYFDGQGGYNIDFNYRDAQRTAVQLETKNLYINVDGIHEITPEQVQRVLHETCDIITKYCGGTVEEMGVVVNQ